MTLLLILSAFIVLPVREGLLDILLPALFGASTEQDHKPFAVLPEIHAVTWPEIDPAFKNAGTYTLDVREVPGREPG